MIINFLGDSITQGAGASVPEKNYVNLVGATLGCTARNYGVGGTRIARQKTPSVMEIFDQDFLLRSEDMEDADFLFIFGGTNDFGHGDAELGELDSEDIYTFCGAFNVLCKKMISRFGKNICVILPLARHDENSPYGDGSKPKAGPILKEYRACMESLTEKWGVETLAFDEEFPTPQTNTGDDLTMDGLHPNDKGHKLLADKICAYLRARFGGTLL